MMWAGIILALGCLVVILYALYMFDQELQGIIKGYYGRERALEAARLERLRIESLAPWCTGCYHKMTYNGLFRKFECMRIQCSSPNQVTLDEIEHRHHRSN